MQSVKRPCKGRVKACIIKLWTRKEHTMNSIFSFYNYIADYKNRSGEDFHNEFQIPKSAVKDETDGALCIKDFLLENGYTPVVILNIKGDFTMAELKKISEGKLFSHKTLNESIKKAEFRYLD
jgi:hypothetical protein